MSNASDLHRWFYGPWCPKCGFCLSMELMEEHVHPIFPGLHTRDPRTKVEGLYWGDAGEDDKGGRYKAGWGLHDFDGTLRPAHAADLLVAGVGKAVKCLQWERINTGYEVMLHDNGPWFTAEARTLPEAVAIAYHRMLDAEDV